jgi:hypothetical protein
MTKKRTKQYFDRELQKLVDEGLIKVATDEDIFGPGYGLCSFTRPVAPASAAEPAEQTPPQAKPRPASKR